jgi:hypothetical protein
MCDVTFYKSTHCTQMNAHNSSKHSSFICPHEYLLVTLPWSLWNRLFILEPFFLICLLTWIIMCYSDFYDVYMFQLQSPLVLQLAEQYAYIAKTLLLWGIILTHFCLQHHLLQKLFFPLEQRCIAEGNYTGKIGVLFI